MFRTIHPSALILHPFFRAPQPGANDRDEGGGMKDETVTE